jgi:hypothetical protein
MNKMEIKKVTLEERSRRRVAKAMQMGRDRHCAGVEQARSCPSQVIDN